MSSTLILGGIKSGKSVLAEQLADQFQQPVIYIATAAADDAEMQRRIDRHQKHRPAHWKTVEEPIHLATIIDKYCAADHCVLIDCLTLWLTNLLMLNDDNILKTEIEALFKAIKKVTGHLIMVSNESNMGIIPMGELTRSYCDEAGMLHQRIALQCDNVVLTVAGLPHVLKGTIHD
jgi:adenosylcobinamide kinase/adenosylcobinamide-phosphate guanylyltransferase